MSAKLKTYGITIGKQLLKSLEPIAKQLAKDAAAKGLTVGGDVAKLIATQLKEKGATGNVSQQVRQLIVNEVGNYAKTQGKDVGKQTLSVVKEIASQQVTGRNVANLLSNVGTSKTTALPIQSGTGKKRTNTLQSQCNPIGQIEHNGKCIGILTGGGHIISTKTSRLVPNLPIYKSDSL